MEMLVDGVIDLTLILGEKGTTFTKIHIYRPEPTKKLTTLSHFLKLLSLKDLTGVTVHDLNKVLNDDGGFCWVDV